ncbi:CusA/CzcA family heavy metal efflux RND transporter [Caulobacter sp. SSI4214]|uniref:efflux RND transporter permease subunit n=1 Tax=Caulobacter sp. SSI4214 TaxID=2575739 RepID=UPI0014397571|nr:CusA/CzcA family heavy metal efflux RND transporter [Caulobacter sp. SSI4214]
MISRVLDLSVRFRWAVLALTLLVAIIGAVNLVRLPIDAVPDITNKQVQINTLAPALAPAEVEKLVTFPIETAMAGIPGLETTRSISRNGFSQVTIVFTEKTDLYFLRQQVAERLTAARESLPAGVEPSMGPISSGLGEVLMWTVEFKHPQGRGAGRKDGAPGWQTDGSYLTPAGERLSDTQGLAAYLHEVQDWIVDPQMRAVAGVAGIDSIGGYEKEYVVEPDPARMIAYGVSFADLGQALEKANVAVGANFLERGGEAYLVRTDARLKRIDEIQDAVIATRAATGVRIRDVAKVRVGGMPRLGAASENGEEVVVGTALMRIGENSRTVAKASAQRLGQIGAALPADIQVKVVYDRSNLVNAAIRTVEKNLAEGALLVVVVLFLLLGNFRAALIAALIIPLSMLVTAIGMNRLGVSGNLMSLGALDFGLIVDGAVIIVENSLRRLSHRQAVEGRILTLAERLAETRDAAREMIKPSVYGQAIILLVYAPLLTFTGVEGKTFTPMAITVMLALAAAFVLSLTFVPAMIALLIRGRVAEKEVVAIRWTKTRYEPLLRSVVARPWPVIGAAVVLFALAAATFGFLGREFTPKLDEKDVLVQSLRIPSTSLEQSLAMQKRVERTIATFPEVAFVFSKTGTAEVAADPMPPGISDGFVILKPRKDWPDPSETKAELVERMEKKLSRLTGNAYEITQPIEMRFNELIAGVRGDVAVKIYGDDLEAMSATARKVAAVLQSVPGAADVKVEQTSGFPTLDVTIDRQAVGQLGLTVEEVTDTLSTAMAGRRSGLVFQGDRRFDIVVRMPDATRHDLDAIGALPVMLPERPGAQRLSVPLREVARFAFSEGLNQVSRENGKRRIVVHANVRGSDLGSFVAKAQAKVAAEVVVPPGSWVEWGGQFENLKAAQARLAIVVPLCFALIFALLYLALGGWAPAAAVFSAIPLALAGGVFALAARGMPFSISAAVGFIALSGVAVLNGLVMMTAIRQRLDDGVVIDAAIIDGALERLRPVMMTGLVASLGFLPMALATETGAEVQRPLATVVIGGLVTATLLTLFVLPAICRLVFRPRPAA